MHLRGIFPLFLLFLPLLASAQTKVKTHEGVMINGIKQWVGAAGTDDTKPILLFLHGGPGFSSRSYAKSFIKHLKKDFIVVQWDQRETGITAHWTPYAEGLTLDLFHQDTEEVIDYVLQRFQKDQLYLVGYSWGNVLGLHYASRHPENLHAYVSVSGMIYAGKSENLTLDATRAKAREMGNKQALAELEGIRFPYQSWEGLYYQRKWANALLGEGKAKDYPTSLVENWAAKWFDLFVTAAQINYLETIPQLDCPVYICSSEGDYVAHHQLSQEFYDQVQAPKMAQTLPVR